MGGRRDRGGNERSDWVRALSDERLAAYERMLASPTAARVRLDGGARFDAGEWFRGLIADERLRRGQG